MTLEDSTEPKPQPASTVRSPAWKSWLENVQILFIALILALLIRTFVAEPRYIPSDSMVPTLEVSDRLVVEKLSYRFRPPELGDIVVFNPPPQLQIQGYAKDQAFIKRIIGKPGQTVFVRDGKVYLDNQPLQEPYITEPPNYTWGPAQVPEGAYFVMGDNRNNSNDSHIWGFLPQQNIIGRAWFRFYPFNRIGVIYHAQPHSSTHPLHHSPSRPLTPDSFQSKT
ncbi:signal peptidase I [Leptothermofonsia sp. ETS-13]|uniref:signal peptidase I n=1 Tax=Leptothermofonsia sp. ETS-13 TaxID=3035696 RepID=UPI003B9F6A10